MSTHPPAAHVDPATALVPTTPGSLQIDYLEKTIGVYFVGYMFAMVLYGFTFFQAYMYYSRYPKDSWGIKGFVALIVVIDTVASGLLSETLYYYLVSLFLFTRGVELATSTFCAQLQLSVIAVFLTQMFYAWSIWRNSKNKVMSGATAFLATVSLVFGTLTTTQLLKDTQFAHMANNPTKTFAALGQGLSAAAAIVSLVGLSWGRLPEGFKPFESYFDQLVGYGVSYGGTNALLQGLYTLVFVGAPSKHYWLPFHFVAEKFFVISTITYLNTRHSSHSTPSNSATGGDNKNEWRNSNSGINSRTFPSAHAFSTTGSVGVGGRVSVTASRGAVGNEGLDSKNFVITSDDMDGVEDISMEKGRIGSGEDEDAFGGRVKSGELNP